MRNFLLFGDGGSRGNPGPAALGYVIYETDQDLRLLEPGPETVANLKLQSRKTYELGKFIGQTTNNVAEWSALVEGLEYITNNFGSASQVAVFLDSELVVKQVLGIYKVKQPHLKPLFTKAIKLKKEISYFQIRHIYREYNKEADSLVNLALDESV
jgi:ribonuclease HI